MALNTDFFKAKLEEQRTALQAEINGVQARTESGHGYSTHQADDGTEAFEQAAGLAVRRNAERLLYEVERALTRIDEGRYGLCRGCGEPIDPARLKAIPYARYCLSCAEHKSEA